MERPQVVVLDLDGLCWCVHALAAESGEGGGKGGWWGGGRGGWAVGELVWVDGLVGPGRARCGVQVFVCERTCLAARAPLAWACLFFTATTAGGGKRDACTAQLLTRVLRALRLDR